MHKPYLGQHILPIYQKNPKKTVLNSFSAYLLCFHVIALFYVYLVYEINT